VPAAIALPAGCLASSPEWARSRSALALPTLALLVLCGAIAGLGHGLAFRAGLAVTASAPADRRGRRGVEALRGDVRRDLPARGRRGRARQAAGLRLEGLAFAGVVATLSALVLFLLWRGRRHEERAQDFERLAA
jgi:hypothetical protein